MNLTLITVNFNNARATMDLLRSLERQTARNFDVIVVDNDSAPDDRALLGSYIASSPLRLDIIYSDRNRGFSGGNNLAIRKALAQGSEWLLLINNDTTVQPDFIALLALPNTPAIVGLPLNEGDRTAYAGIIKWLRPTLPHAYHRVGGAESSYAIGAGILIHRDVFERIGLLDEHYFLYFEDADFSLRARYAGIPIQFLEEPVITHRTSESTKKLGRPLLIRYHARNALRFNWRNGPWWVKAAVPLAVCYGIALQSAKLLFLHRTAESRATLTGIFDFIFGRWGRIPTLPVIAVECESLEDVSWGMARQVRGFLNAFVELPQVRERYEVVAYFKSRIPDEPWLHHTHVSAVIVRPFGWLPASFSLYFYVFFPLRLWFDRPAVTYIANFMLPLIFRGKSIVMLTEDIWYEMRGSALPFKYRLAYRIFATWASRRATRIMAISHTSATRVAELFGISPERIAVNELAITPAHVVVPRAGSYVLYVAQGLPRRHLRETILAFAVIAPQHPEMTLYAIGPDKYQPPVISDLVETTNRALGHPAIVWTQRVTDDELASAYAGARLLVYVSDMEAFGLPPVEALAYRVPSVVMDAPVHRELLGSHAFYTNSAQPRELAAVIERGLTDEAHRQDIEHAAESIVSRYTWEKHARRMLGMIEDII